MDNDFFHQSFSKVWHWLDSKIPDSPISRPLNAENSSEFSLCIQFYGTGKRVFGSFSSTVPSKKAQFTQNQYGNQVVAISKKEVYCAIF